LYQPFCTGRGADPEIDEAIHYQPMLEEFLSQAKGENISLPQCYQTLAEILNQTPENLTEEEGQRA